MNTGTFWMMVAILGFTWGGFVLLLAYGAIRESRKG
jgi:hypothetical protein